MRRCVMDASSTLAWCFSDEEGASPLPELAVVVPALWALEVANGLMTGERRGRITSAAATALVPVLQDALAVEIDTEADVFRSVLPIAREYGLSIYDATYLELALRRFLPLITLDRRLQEAAAAAGVEISPALR
ncbi:MAG: type II toxin-antitoxin system VapC family toxin [Thermaerobacter sp.]|nr:type II toxin-antitoxin system VapC family toxin [Thermaerobacter sp.]MDA8205802.1 type II toxin-antitoxin system VapC family toxin [Thermaerobacter sp.]